MLGIIFLNWEICIAPGSEITYNLAFHHIKMIERKKVKILVLQYFKSPLLRQLTSLQHTNDLIPS